MVETGGELEETGVTLDQMVCPVRLALNRSGSSLVLSLGVMRIGSPANVNLCKYAQRVEDHRAIVNATGTENIWVNVILKFLGGSARNLDPWG